VLIRIRNFFISIFYHCGIESTVRILRISAAFTEAFPLFVDYEATTRRADDADVDLHLHSEPYFRCVDVQNNRARQTASAWRTLCRHRRLRARRFTQKKLPSQNSMERRHVGQWRNRSDFVVQSESRYGRVGVTV